MSNKPDDDDWGFFKYILQAAVLILIAGLITKLFKP